VSVYRSNFNDRALVGQVLIHTEPGPQHLRRVRLQSFADVYPPVQIANEGVAHDLFVEVVYNDLPKLAPRKNREKTELYTHSACLAHVIVGHYVRVAARDLQTAKVARVIT
jgi:hypothetical protein